MRSAIKAGIGVAALTAAAFIVWKFQPAPSVAPPLDASPAPSLQPHTVSSVELPQAVFPPPASPASARAVKFPWGSGNSQLGRTPSSIAATASGETLVLDQTNKRIVRFGKYQWRWIPLPDPPESADDFASAADGRIAVLQRRSNLVTILEPDGKVLGKLPIQGEHVGEAAGVTAIFVRGANVMVEYLAGMVVGIGTTAGVMAGERTEVQGRPSADQQFTWAAGIMDGEHGLAWISSLAMPSADHRFTRQMQVGMPLRKLLLLDTDTKGNVYVAFASDGKTILACLDPRKADPLGVLQLPVGTPEAFRELAVRPDGGVVQLQKTDEGVTIASYECP